MQANLVFTGPGGPTASSEFNPANLERLIRREGEAYWNAGLGCGTIAYRPDGPFSGRFLGLTYKDGLGFHITLGQQKTAGGQAWWAAAGSDDFVGFGEVRIGGNPVKIPLALFVPRADAWDIVAGFCATGDRPGRARWVDWNDSRWDEFRELHQDV